ncbi:Ldh family oxidoreductase [Spongiactinospora sp. TRM90649]|uniref:Ldh family oxidoreductase n=1 Tax=Spongiactinospora sp. TRM90649 TaxID=3031114 RepID=UPI0023F73B73|nr:Ldh family oxidoreductase [Spongiactinospora sp. TRM90649]MDF5757685.1 Ldh family oxidoreductase [Spongiactinospora sp. TRM90649]
MLSLRDLVVAVGGRDDEVVILRGADLDVPPGATVIVQAARGSGKSVLGAVLRGRLRPRFGEVRGNALIMDDADLVPAEHLSALLARRRTAGLTTVLMCTEVSAERRALADRVYVLARGALVPEPAPAAAPAELRMPSGEVRDRAVTALRGAGADSGTAGLVADVLVEADVRGHHSHGVGLLPTYLERVEKGGIDPAAEPVVTERGATARIDARAGFGQVAAARAAEWCAAKAAELGVAAVAVHGNNHVGMMAAYRWPFQRRRVIGLLYNISGPSLAAPGAVRPTLGSNAVCMVTPADGDEPFVVDFATGVVALGKIRDAAYRGEGIPPDWLLDREGRPTTDPADLERGGSVPVFGGYKGLGVTIMAEVLAGMLAGQTISPLVAKQRKHPEQPMNASQLFIGLSLDAFGLTAPGKLVDALREAVADGYAGDPPMPYFPDQKEAAGTARARREGISVAPGVADALGWR